MKPPPLTTSDEPEYEYADGKDDGKRNSEAENKFTAN